jgi:hypothetical protein
MKKFTLLSHDVTRPVEEHTYILQDDNGKLVYKEWIDEKGEVVDSVLRDKDGYTIEDWELYDKVQNFIENQKEI